MTEPLVSVIVPVYNCRDTVESALESALTQTLPPDRVEVIAVDDGSTDGSAELLDEMARAHDRLTVVHQPNTGGAGAPRNKGLDLASGTFVFFLDADDRLGPEALARMTAMAERNGTDIVLGKQVGTGGRKVPRVFERTIERTHVLDPDCDLFPKISMAALQMFRRSLIDKAELRFTEGLLSHEDHLFTTGAYLQASGVSVLADYDCYYWAARQDGTSSTQVGGAPTAEVHAITAQAMAMIAEHTEPGGHRERLHYRYLQQEVFARLERRYLDSSADEQKILRAGCKELLDAWFTPGLRARYSTLRRLLAYCVQHDLDAQLEQLLRFHKGGTRPTVLLENGQAFSQYPFFRDKAAGIPDTCFETDAKLRPVVTGVTWDRSSLTVSGTVTIEGVDEGTPDVHLVLENGQRDHHRITCETGPGHASGTGRATPFTGVVGPPSGSWRDGRWTLSVEAVIEGHTLTTPLTKPRGLALPHALIVPSDAGIRLVRPLPAAVRRRGALEIEVGGGLGPSDLRNVEFGWAPGRRLRVTGEAPLVATSDTRPDMTLLLQRPGGGAVLRAPLTPDPDRPSYSVAEVPLAGVRRGSWRVSLQVDGLGDPVELRVPGGKALGPVTASVLPPRRVHVRPNPMTVYVTAPLTGRLRRIMRRPVQTSGTAKTDQPQVEEGKE